MTAEDAAASRGTARDRIALRRTMMRVGVE
jgi:hypothetical protein